MPLLLILAATPASLLDAGHTNHPDIFARRLRHLDATVTVRHANPYEADVTEEEIETADGVVFVGSSVPWATDAAEAAPLRRAMEQVFDSGTPSWGSCNGMQLAATVLGGTVGASPNGMEIGLAQDIALTEKGKAHPMMEGRATTFAAPCIHRDEVTGLPRGAVLLAHNAHSHVQAFAYTEAGVDFWGTQYHPELDPGAIAGIMRLRGESPDTADHLDRATSDPASAARFGTTPAALAPDERARELTNWLAHLRTHASGTIAMTTA